MSADEALAFVVAHAGATPWKRDAVDERLIHQLTSYGTEGAIRTSISSSDWPSIAAGTPDTDSDGDGMPDWWERLHGLNPNDPTDRNGDANGNGYTNLEDFLHDAAQSDS